MARAETMLAESEVVEVESVEDTRHRTQARPPLGGRPLTTERLRRAVNATLADRGVRDAGDTAIGAGPSAADLHYVGDDPIRPGETVLIDISPRGPDGYRGDLT